MQTHRLRRLGLDTQAGGIDLQGLGEPLPIPFLMGTVGIGEILTASIMGTVLLCVLDRYKNVIFKTA